MTGEVRVTIEDDEVFEYMKRRKAELDLSWEQVLHRGLRSKAAVEGVSEGQLPLERLGFDTPVRDVITAFGGRRTEEDQGMYDVEVKKLKDAEDGELEFDFLDGAGRYRIPLRVIVHTDNEGMEIEVVSVRRGRNVNGYNWFNEDDRVEIAKQLSSEGGAILYLNNGREEYEIVPDLTWGRNDSDQPTIVDVGIKDVILEDD